MRCLSFFADNEFYAVDVTLVQKVVRKMVVTPVPTAPGAVVGIANLKGRVVTLLDLTCLLGRVKKRTDISSDIVDAVVFKSLSGGANQTGLVIDKPGNLIDVDDDAISLPPLTTDSEDSYCISGIAEVDDRLYRIISIDSIIERYKHTGEKAANTMPVGGDESNE